MIRFEKLRGSTRGDHAFEHLLGFGGGGASSVGQDQRRSIGDAVAEQHRQFGRCKLPGAINWFVEITRNFIIAISLVRGGSRHTEKEALEMRTSLRFPQKIYDHLG